MRDKLPATVDASLNNMAAFYSDIMSERAIPQWENVAPPPDIRSHRLDNQISNALEQNITAIPSALDTDIDIKEV